jgi:catechol 2,3-dioxygenase
MENNKTELIDPKTKIGHIHLKVANLERSVKFYTKILGFKLMTKWGNEAAFLSAGGYHHHIGLNTWRSENGSPPPKNTTGLYHFAILVPSKKELARVYKRLEKNKWPIDGASDHGVSEAIYLRDPDENGIEIYFDKPKNKWEYDSKGNLILNNLPLDIENLLKEVKN